MRPLFLALFLFHHFLSTAQTPSFPPIRCGNDLFSGLMRNHYPELQSNFEATFENARHAATVDQRSPYVIQVVVHVVWKEDAENLADSIIENQLQVLNADYNRLNADTAQLRPVFQPVAGNAGIQFQLASIVRVHTDQVFNVDLFGTNLLPEVKHDADGGSTAWNTQQYLNIWICQVQPISIFGVTVGQILGFSFPPADLANWPGGSNAPNADEDGVVVDYRTIGSNNPNPIQVPGGTANLDIRGRTLVHEVGHYLGLRHIWGDGGLLGPNDCAQSDGVDDTPFANAQSNFDCDITRNTCPQVEAFYNADLPDLIENYMDYSSETCMNMFTKGQVQIMHNVLQGPRAGLLASSGVTNVVAGTEWEIYPNPASGNATIAFRMAEYGDVSLRITDANGRLVERQSAPNLAAGPQQLLIETGRLAAGTYFVRLQTGDHVAVRRLAVVR